MTDSLFDLTGQVAIVTGTSRGSGKTSRSAGEGRRGPGVDEQTP